MGGAPIESAALPVTQAMIDEFAHTTHDSNWIHIDRERARRESPYATTVAHGFLTLSLLVPLFAGCVRFEPSRLVLNYGFERVRFIAPVPAGSVVRGTFRLALATPVERGTRLTWNVEVTVDESRPALAAAWILLLLP